MERSLLVLSGPFTQSTQQYRVTIERLVRVIPSNITSCTLGRDSIRNIGKTGLRARASASISCVLHATVVAINDVVN